jgi:hypothetical protein
MYIIYDPNTIEQLKQDQRYTLLELDTIRHSDQHQPITAYCVIDSIPLSELGQASAYVTWHQELIEDYKHQNWENCLQTIPMLMGHFNGEVDSFYSVLEQRIKQLIDQGHPKDWSPVLDVSSAKQTS